MENADQGNGTETWSAPAWRAQAVSWLDEQLAAVGVERTGEVDQPHLRPWATVLSAPTTGGRVWLKAAGPGTAFEVRLYELLDRVAPNRILRPLAIDVARGWVVLPDGGPPLGERATGADLIEALADVLPQYARLQREMSAHAEGLIGVGVPDMRAAVMPKRFEEALDAIGRYVEHDDSTADRAAYRRLPGLRASFASWCHVLDSLPGGASLDHNDLHPWNILLSRTGGARDAQFYDWGDSVVAHPFASMRLPLAFLQRYYHLDSGAKELVRVRDAYLEVFGDLGKHAELVEALELACHVGKVARALTWDRVLRALGSTATAGLVAQPVRCLAALLDSSYLSGGWPTHGGNAPNAPMVLPTDD